MHLMPTRQTLIFLVTLVGLTHALQPTLPSVAAEGAETVEFYGYADCIRLSNGTTQAVLCPAAGGRILSYAMDGENILYLPAGDEGWTWDGKSTEPAPMTAGRCDVGPEQIVAKRPTLWQGLWTGEIIADRTAVLRSQTDPSTGLRLERLFSLAANSSKLTFTQTIINASSRPIETCHWSRTFVRGKGTCIVPVSRPSRFPQFYVRYDPPGKLINFAPDDPQIKLQGDYLIINDHPLNPKLGFDSYVGWLAYQAQPNLLFVKKFATYPDRPYNEVAGLTISVWYPDREMVELEPIGPAERLQPGQQAAFTETWYLLKQPYSGSAQVEPASVAAVVEALR
jgi:hypothetical protein